MGKTRQSGPIRDMALDLGTSTTLVAARGRGILLRVPSVAAVDRHTGQVLRVGEEARELLGRTPAEVLAVRPLEGGVLRDQTLGESMVRGFLQQAAPGRAFRPRLLLSVPTGARQVDERAVVDAALGAGARKVCLMEAPLAAALGAGLDIGEPKGRMVVDVGGGVTDAAIIALGAVAASACLPAAGDAFDRALIRYVREEKNVDVGRRAAEGLKVAVGRVGPGEKGAPFSVKGRCRTTGLPREIALTAGETAEALAPVAAELLRGVLEVLERAPGSLAADAAAEGILLTGGGCQLRGLDAFLAEGTGLPIRRAEDPETTVVLGLEQALDTLSRRQEGVLDLARRRAVAGEV